MEWAGFVKMDWICKFVNGGYVKYRFVKGGFVKHGFVKGGFVKGGFDIGLWAVGHLREVHQTHTHLL